MFLLKLPWRDGNRGQTNEIEIQMRIWSYKMNVDCFCAIQHHLACEYIFHTATGRTATITLKLLSLSITNITDSRNLGWINLAILLIWFHSFELGLLFLYEHLINERSKSLLWLPWRLYWRLLKNSTVRVKHIVFAQPNRKAWWQDGI